MKSLIFTNVDWLHKVLYPTSYTSYTVDNYTEYIGATIVLHPIFDHVASNNKSVFDPKKAAAMYFWYKSADKTDKSIVEYFKEYEKCIDKTHQWFNSNYGVYAYKQCGLQRCIDVLIKHKNSRQACFCINNNKAMSPESIDKLCTNTIQFFIRHNYLTMIVNMRSSNMLTLLPYDFFIFSIWYAQVYNKLIKTYDNLKVGNIILYISSLHFYAEEVEEKNNCSDDTNLSYIFTMDDMNSEDFQNILETKLIKFLNG